MSESSLPAVDGMKTIKMEVKKGQLCPICGVAIVDEKGEIPKPIMATDVLGAVHQACFLPLHDERELKVLVKIRCYSIGDTIASTPVIRELRRCYPEIRITVMTFFPELFKYHPEVSAVIDLNQPVPAVLVESHHFAMDAFDSENRHHFAMHSVEFAMQSAFNRSVLPNRWEYEVNYAQAQRDSMLEVLRATGVDLENDKLILIHPHGTEWKTRDWGPLHMQKITDDLLQEYPDHKIVNIGGKRGEVPTRELKNYVELNGAHYNLYGKLSLLESLALFDLPNVKLLITPDTGTMHLGAASRHLPIVGIFTLIRSTFRTPVRNGEFSYNFTAVEKDGCCCTYDAKQLTTEARFDSCPRGTFLRSIRDRNLPFQIKLNGLRNMFRDVSWPSDEKQVLAMLSDMAEQYSAANLPCFPDVWEVMTACRDVLDNTMRPPF